MFSALSQAWRSWKTAKGVAALATLAFAVGIGSATAIYTVVRGVMLKPLPYAGSDRFVALYGGRISEPGQRSAHTFPDLLEYQQRTRSFDVFGSFRPGSFRMIFQNQPQHLVGAAVTPSLAHNLGVQPGIGQWFHDDRGAVISHALWTRLGADPAIVGQAMTLDDRVLTITGVMPAAFHLPVHGPGVERIRSDVWIALDPKGTGLNPASGLYFSYARLKPGVTLAQADADVKRVAVEIAALNPASHPGYTAQLEELRESVISTIKPTLMLLVGAAGLLLLITCADVAGLLLARTVARSRETAIRVALGAAQRQLALHYFMEGLLVSLAGAAAGFVLSLALVRIVLSIAVEHIPRADEIAVDGTVIAFSLGMALLASALASMAPLWQAIRTAPADVLSDGVRSTAGVRSRRLSESLVVAEIALAFTLLVAGSVLIVHLRNLTRIDAGFETDGLLTFQLSVLDTTSKREQRAAFQERFTAALEGIPGVSSVGFANRVPLDGCCLSTAIYPEGAAVDPDAVERTSFMAVNPGYFRTMRIPLRSGRFLDERDVHQDLLQAVINEAAAKAYWPGRNPVGAFGRAGNADGARFQVVGVVGDVRNDGLNRPPVPEIYLPSAIIEVNPMRFVLRSPRPPDALVSEVRRAVQSIDPGQPIHGVTSVEDIVRKSVSIERVGSFMVAFFALAALLMATLGIYSVVSYSVRRGTVEIGTRMALGAVGRDLLWMVVRRGLRLTAWGALLGSVAVVASSWILIRVFEIRGVGAFPFVLSTVIVGSVATIASFFPAWRATLVSPMVAIRNEPGSMWQSARRSIRQSFEGLARAVSVADAPAGERGDVLTEFVAAARAAASFDEAFHLALATLCGRMGATSAVLLENNSGRYRRLAAFPDGRDSDWSLPSDGLLANRLRFHSYPLPLSDGDLESWMRWAGHDNSPGFDEIQSLKQSGARLAVPLRAREEVPGVLLLGAPEGRGEYSIADRHLLRHCAEQLTLMIENARLTARVVEQEKLRRDLALAAEVQRRLLPDHPPEASAAALSAVSLPARTVGGDYYDFLDLGDHRIGIALADIAGKGIAAALIMAVVQASLRIVAADDDISLPELVAKINAFLHRSTGANSYATFFYAQLDQRNRQLRYVNAGHNPPYLLRSGSLPAATANLARTQVEELSIGGTVLGLFPEMSYQEGTVDLRPGDVLVAFTDGVTEALNSSDQEFGEDRLKDVLRGLLHLPAAEISARLSDELRTWIRDTAQYDDLTFVVMKVT
jgi:putative ABC transport system permease protein